MIPDLNNTSALVKFILETDARTRNSDNLLYLKVLEMIFEGDAFIDVYSLTVPYFLTHMNELHCPAFETVRRSRQKVQHDFPALAASNAVRDHRKENEEIFREFALR